jgi:hypothetical protein
MNSFISQYAQSVIGVLSGFDRLVFRGRLQRLCYAQGLQAYLNSAGVLLKDFGRYAEKITARLKESSLHTARQENRPIRYWASSKTDKEELAQGIAARDHITEGTVCVLSCVEPCMGYEIYRNAETHRLELRARTRKCLHLYHYLVHPQLGFLHARIQTWFPFAMHICLNGREWLSHPMDAAGLAYRRRDNCFPWIEDFAAAQRLMDQQVSADWPRLLKDVVQRIHPALDELLPQTEFWAPWEYRWSVFQSEWATDITFRTREELQQLYPRLIRHAILNFGPTDVLRFMGRKLNRDGSVPGYFNGEVTIDVKERPEGTRLKFWLDRNSGTMYDKWNILRAETTLNDPHGFKVFRHKETEPDGPLAWLPLRKGIADLRRRAEVSQAANNRLLEAQAAVSGQTSLAELTAGLCRRAQLAGRERAGQPRPVQRFRALNPWAAEDADLLTAIARPEFALNGFRNRDLAAVWYAQAPRDAEEARRRSAAVTRKIRLLRAHGLIRKVPSSHRYQVSSHGLQAITALLAARNSNAELLSQLAA